jgi:hypothetical protein
MMNWSAKDGARSSRHYGGEGASYPPARARFNVRLRLFEEAVAIPLDRGIQIVRGAIRSHPFESGPSAQ